MTVGHIGADESRKGGVSILGCILRQQDVMLDCSMLEDQKADTEFRGSPFFCVLF